MDSTILWCRACGGGIGGFTEVPPLCPHCGEPAHYTTTAPPDVPRTKYELTHQDRVLMLRRMGIKDEPTT